MALTSLKCEYDEGPEAMRQNGYGYGTEIRLSGEQCEAMGITAALAVGQPVTIRALGVVSRSGEELEASTDSGGKDVTLCIQLTDLEMKATGQANAAAAAAMLYGDDE